MESTVCHYPWNTIYIEPDGRVFPCCHGRPFAIGNVYEDTLEEIMHGPLADEVRAMAKAGTLPCFSACNRAPSRRFHNAGDKPYPAPDRIALGEVHINISYKCNIRCVMCRQDHRLNTVLDPQRLMEAIPWSSSPRLIVQGGEPLVIPAAWKLARFVRDRTDSSLILITNATRLTGKWRRLLTSRDHECHISLNGATRAVHERVNRGSSWRRVTRAAEKLAELKEKTNSRTSITFHMTVVPLNAAEMPAFIRYGNARGFVDRITFGFDKKTMPGWIGKNRELFLDIYREFLDEAAGSRVQCDAFRLFQLARVNGLEDNRLEFGPKGQLVYQSE